MIKHIEILRLLDSSRNESLLTLVTCVPLIINYGSSTSTIGNACPLVLETSIVCPSNHYFLMGSVCSALVPYSN